MVMTMMVMTMMVMMVGVLLLLVLQESNGSHQQRPHSAKKAFN